MDRRSEDPPFLTIRKGSRVPLSEWSHETANDLLTNLKGRPAHVKPPGAATHTHAWGIRCATSPLAGRALRANGPNRFDVGRRRCCG